MRSLKRGRVDVAVLQETKIVKAKFAAWSYRGYTLRVPPSSGKNCGGIGLVVGEANRFTVESAKVVGPNVISFQLLTRKDGRWHVVGCCFLPSDKEGAARRLTMEALDAKIPFDW